MAERSYPGDMASPAQVEALADAYRQAAHALLALGKKGEPVTRAPFRLTAIHAIELYLNAYLLRCGCAAAEIRALQHDLQARAERALANGLRLKRKTAEHLRSMSAAREYLVSRYSPDLVSAMSQVNRLVATLDEVAEKVAKAAPQANKAAPAPSACTR